MNISSKAPVGGMVSNVNGQFYTGGEFMPVTGEFCGTGKHKIEAKKLADINAKLEGKKIAWDEKLSKFKVIKSFKMSDGSTGENVMIATPSFKTALSFACSI